MWSRIGIIAVIGMLLNVMGTRPALASATPAIQYSAGWNMVGAPLGTDFSAAAGVFAYSGSGYTALGTSQAGGCQGYWAYFSAPTSVGLNGTPPAGTSMTCPLIAGWNLVGDPFAVEVNLPPGMTAYYWNPVTLQYDVVTGIPAGGAVWILAAGPGTITLTPTGTATTGAVFTFGREGGNIVPYQVTIAVDGTVSVSGPAPVQTSVSQISQQELSILEAQVFSGGLLTLPAHTDCPGSLPDFASLFIEVQGSQYPSGDVRVSVRGNCVPAFAQLFAALSTASGLASPFS